MDVLEPNIVSLTLVPPAPINVQIVSGGGGGVASIQGTANEIEVTPGDPTIIGLPDDVYATHFHGNLLGKVTAEVKNTSGVTIEKGMPVYVIGTVGSTHVLEVAICKSNTIDPTTTKSEICIGLLEDTLQNNEFGHVVLCGLLEDVNTNTPTTWLVGETLYLNSVQTNATHTHNWLTNDPLQITDDQSLQTVGSITRSNANNGSIFVNPKLHERVSKMRLSNLVDVNSDTDSIYAGRQLLSKGLGVNGTWGAISELTYALHGQFTYINGASATDPQTGLSLTYGPVLPAFTSGARGVWDRECPQWDNESEVWIGRRFDHYRATLFRPYNGQRIFPYVVTATGFAATSTSQNNITRLMPFTVGYDTVVSGLETYVTAFTGSGIAVKYQLYESDVNGRPTGAPLEESGSIGITAANATYAYVFPANRTLEAGKTYWIGCKHQSISGFSVTFRGFSSTSFHSISWGLATGITNTMLSITDTFGAAARNYTTTPWNISTEVTGGVNFPGIAFVVV
jgi:hypothetical protein